MLTFIIPLKSKAVSQSWELVSQLFERCIRSICSQTSSDYNVVVVCNEKPDIQFDHPKITYLQVDFMPEDKSNIRDKRLDKGRRILTGLIHAKTLGSTHTMVVDADDCVSKHLAAFVEQHSHAPGWYINRGYVWQENSKLIYYRKSSFHCWCGTSKVIRLDLHNLPDGLETSHPLWSNYEYDHKEIRVAENVSLAPLPFSGAIYVIGNGENIYQTGFSRLHKMNWQNYFFRVKDMLNYRLLTPAVQQEFNLYQL